MTATPRHLTAPNTFGYKSRSTDGKGLPARSRFALHCNCSCPKNKRGARFAAAGNSHSDSTASPERPAGRTVPLPGATADNFSRRGEETDPSPPAAPGKLRPAGPPPPPRSPPQPLAFNDSHLRAGRSSGALGSAVCGPRAGDRGAGGQARTPTGSGEELEPGSGNKGANLRTLSPGAWARVLRLGPARPPRHTGPGSCGRSAGAAGRVARRGLRRQDQRRRPFCAAKMAQARRPLRGVDSQGRPYSPPRPPPPSRAAPLTRSRARRALGLG